MVPLAAICRKGQIMELCKILSVSVSRIPTHTGLRKKIFVGTRLVKRGQEQIFRHFGIQMLNNIFRGKSLCVTGLTSTVLALFLGKLSSPGNEMAAGSLE